MIDLIDRWDDARSAVQQVVEDAAHVVALDQVQLLAPIGRPGKIMAMGLNYADHVAEAGLEIPKHQVWFCKQPNTVHPPYAPIQIPKASKSVDYEVELVLIVGKRGRHLSRADAPDHIFGYCVGNDVTARDWQMRTPQWVLGKSFDSHGPFGPWITTSDEIGDPHRLGIRSIVNDEVRQNSNTRELIFDVFDQVTYLSQAMTLEPGDIVFSGTPGGIGAAMKPPVFLKAGDRVRCEIDELGALDAVFENEA
ncbi:fumarylacetoacetate hydrolase family protein [Paraburkholderia madseniana]|uniref:Fumarylacetoacetate hydrolase family protein n=1 Tax=Paraburkholderia madseniana TaxID=2599607 RepID=A0AAP5ER85_9BURK|nr:MULTISPECIES: fumarylacetoacetate hydrolase family protein [Paraburkholderia]MCX4149653.1 fumarylacetoacetate hydrolase family protein [Paraburkholderia madseniana]MDN7152589.1 fumarylacetoacetate hydrolase family protein [Paraburkholderia sp. WS6]MDQ6411471.1 fumarylacetoacetate hydrolase family protein [Paraburkholderia madseniana]